MSALDRAERWGRWYDRLVDVRNRPVVRPTIEALASELCDLEDHVDILREENAGMRRTIQAQARDARTARMKYQDRGVLLGLGIDVSPS